MIRPFKCGTGSNPAQRMKFSKFLHPNSLCRNFLNFYPFFMKIIAIKFVNVCQRIHTRPWVKKISYVIFDLQNKNTPSKIFKNPNIYNFQSFTNLIYDFSTSFVHYVLFSGGNLKNSPPKMKACLYIIVCC